MSITSPVQHPLLVGHAFSSVDVRDLEVAELHRVRRPHREGLDWLRDHLLEVRLLVCRQVALLVKALRAVREAASVRFLSRVDPHVRLQVEIERELLPTHFALVRLFALGGRSQKNGK